MITVAGYQELAEIARYRNNVYGLLSVVYSGEPTLEFLRAAREEVFLKTLEELGVVLGDDFTGRPVEDLLLDLTVEYTRLFIGPGKHISPHESVYVTPNGSAGEGIRSKGLLWGEATVRVKELLSEYGLHLKDTFKGIPDHLGVELQAMYLLSGGELAAWSSGEEGRAKDFLKKEAALLTEHLCRWVPSFCDLVVEQTRESFYRGMAKITRDFLLTDQQQVMSLLMG